MILTGNGTNDGDKLVEVLSGPDGNGCAGKEGENSEKVLLPLDKHVVLARPSKQTSLHDTDGREELKGDREHDGNRVQCLDRLNQMALLRQVQENNRLGLGSKGGIRQSTEGGEEDCNTDHNSCQHLGELFGLLHRLCNRDNQSNTLEREHYEQKEVIQG